MNNEKDILQQLEALKQENADSVSRCQTWDIKFNALLKHAQNSDRLELQIKKLQNCKEQNRKDLCELRNKLVQLGNQKSMRLAKMFQIINNPQMIDAKSSLGALFKILISKIRGKELLPEYLAVSDAISAIDNLLAEYEPIKEKAPWSGDQSKLISVVLPVYNQADLVHESIESVLAQIYTNWELIIINDGSTDNLAEAVKPYLSDSRIRYFEQKNQRLPKALSNGFSFAKGELITWTSADNNMRPQMLARLADFLNQHPEVDMVYADYMAIDDKGGAFTSSWFRPQNKLDVNSPYLYLPRSAALLNIVQDNFIGASFMYRQNTLKIIKDYDPQLGVEDYDYWMRINDLLTISHLGSDEILYDYRVHDNTLNAKAAEFKIHEKVSKLMDYEKERFHFYFLPFNIYGSYQEKELVSARFTVKFAGAHIKEDANLKAPCKNILLVKGSELSCYAFEELEKYDFIAAFFAPGEENDAGKCAWLIRKFNIFTIAPKGSKEYLRLSTLTDNIFDASNVAIDTILAAANNTVFLSRTRTKEELSRVLPAIPEKESGRIIILLENIGSGGLEQVAFDMFKSFRKAGRKVLFVSVNGAENQVKVPEGTEFTDLGGDISKFPALLTEQPCDAVFAHYCTQGAREAFENGVKFFQVLHNNYVWLNENAKQQYREADRYTCAYIAVSANVAWYSAECIGVDEDKIIIIENGIVPAHYMQSDTEREETRKRFGFTEKDFVICNPASCYATKGQLALVNAFAEAYKKNPDLRLILAGKIFEEPYYQNIVKFINENQLDKVVFHGKHYDNMSEIYNCCDAVALASFWEGCSLAVAEAICMNKPVIATKVGDIERQTDRKNALLIDLPFKYLTDLKCDNFADALYNPSADMISELADKLLKAANGEFPKSEKTANFRSADEVYARYLAVLNYIKGNLSVERIRHNI